MNHVCVNGKMLPADQPVLTADNKSYRYGDGLFETMKMIGKEICLGTYHFERLFKGLRQLGFNLPSHLDATILTKNIFRLCEKNQCGELARIRLSTSRGHGGLYDGNDDFGYIIECWPASDTLNQLNENGLVTGIYPDARKACDAFSGLKSANYLPYTMAARYAKSRQWNDSLVLNNFDRIADASIANIFLITGKTIHTPPLSEGCVEGVMRRHLLEKLGQAGYALREEPVTTGELMLADELFLTNATSGIRWVKECGDKQYTHSQTIEIYKRFVKTIWE